MVCLLQKVFVLLKSLWWFCRQPVPMTHLVANRETSTGKMVRTQTIPRLLVQYTNQTQLLCNMHPTHLCHHLWCHMHIQVSMWLSLQCRCGVTVYRDSSLLDHSPLQPLHHAGNELCIEFHLLHLDRAGLQDKTVGGKTRHTGLVDSKSSVNGVLKTKTGLR